MPRQYEMAYKLLLGYFCVYFNYGQIKISCVAQVLFNILRYDIMPVRRVPG